VRYNGHLFDLVSLASVSNRRIPVPYCDDICFYPEKYIVDLEQALASMRHFCSTGQLCPEFTWSNAADYDPYDETQPDGELLS
jgi:hypothetical protein